MKTFETVNSECLCSELTISNKNWVCFGVYRTPSQENLELFFDELSSCLSKASETYENFVVTGDFYIDIKTKDREYEKFKDFFQSFQSFKFEKIRDLF